MYYFICFWYVCVVIYGFPLVLNTSPYRTFLLLWFGTRWVFNVLFFICSDNMSCRHATQTQAKHYVPNSMCCFPLCFDNMSAWHVIRTKGKHYILYSTWCFLRVLIIFHADMLSEHKENNTFNLERNVSPVFW